MKKYKLLERFEGLKIGTEIFLSADMGKYYTNTDELYKPKVSRYIFSKDFVENSPSMFEEVREEKPEEDVLVVKPDGIYKGGIKVGDWITYYVLSDEEKEIIDAYRRAKKCEVETRGTVITRDGIYYPEVIVSLRGDSCFTKSGN